MLRASTLLACILPVSTVQARDETVFANALALALESAWRNYQCSYIDLVVEGDDLHIFMPHRWRQAVHLTLEASDLEKLPTRAELVAAIEAGCKPAPDRAGDM